MMLVFKPSAQSRLLLETYKEDLDLQCILVGEGND